jgi:acetyl-CoA carboxylase biotin carboxyl carrier protein
MKPEDIAELKQLIDFLKENQVAEFDLDRGDLKIRLKFMPQQTSGAGLGELGRLLSNPRPQPAHPAVTASPKTASTVLPAATGPVSIEKTGLHVVKSPIVGTFYGAPSPGQAPFVSPGDHVEKGRVICVVEAMKLMNEIESDASGEIVECFVSNGQPIEFGQPLFSIRPS